MIHDLQRASMLKRVSAWLLDAILLCIAATMMAWLLSIVLNYDSYHQQFESRYAYHEAEFGISSSMFQSDSDTLEPDQLASLEAFSKALSEDKEAVYAYNMLINLIIIMLSFGILLAYILLEFVVPMIFGHGQTIGKKIFSIAVMRQDSVRVNGVCMFIRTVLGKFAIETMIPAIMLLMLAIGAIGLIGLLIIGTIIAVEAMLFFTTKERCTIHDKLANTVTIDFASQMIFDTPEDLMAYQKKFAAEKAARQSY